MSDQLMILDRFIKNFFEEELFWIANREYQCQAWTESNGDWFFEASMLFTESWSIIRQNRNKHRLTDQEFQMINEVEKMLTHFEDTYYLNANKEFPSTPREHRDLLQNPEWRKIQEYANRVYQRIYPNICQDHEKLGVKIRVISQ